MMRIPGSDRKMAKVTFVIRPGASFGLSCVFPGSGLAPSGPLAAEPCVLPAFQFLWGGDNGSKVFVPLSGSWKRHLLCQT